jgi:hypothetical protein
MSKIAPTVVFCPRCQARQRARLFDSLNADRVPAQVELLLAGTFERVHCEQCGHDYRPEHTMLYAHFSARTWIIMHPREDRPRFTTIERGVELVMQREMSVAPPIVAEGTQDIRPRLVFGQHMLTEAVRTMRAGIDPALLECAKLLAVRGDLQRFLDLGPFELCFEQTTDSGELAHAIHALASGEKIGTLLLPAQALADAQAARPLLEQSFPDLFQRPYVSACRYLYGATL